MNDRILVKDKKSFKQGAQLAFVLADMLLEEFNDGEIWNKIEGSDTLSCAFKDEIAKKISEYFERMINIEEKTNWPDYKFLDNEDEQPA